MASLWHKVASMRGKYVRYFKVGVCVFTTDGFCRVRIGTTQNRKREIELNQRCGFMFRGILHGAQVLCRCSKYHEPNCIIMHIYNVSAMLVQIGQ